MLTKFAMVFFIMLLAFIMVSFTDTEKQAICRTQAQAVAQSLASTLTNVINSPVEDERKVVSLESSLSLGRTDLSRYTIQIQHVKNEGGKGGFLNVLVQTPPGCDPLDSARPCQCDGRGRASYEEDTRVVNPENLGSSLWPDKTVLLLEPSNTRRRDYYLVAAKCQPKTKGFSNYLYLAKCGADLGTLVDPQTCPPILEQDPVRSCCGWGVDPGVNCPR